LLLGKVPKLFIHLLLRKSLLHARLLFRSPGPKAKLIGHNQSMGFWRELRRRRVYRMAGFYVVGAWLVIQVADVFFPAWGLPETALRFLIVATILCFPIALIFSWTFDITTSGIVKTEPADPGEIFDNSLKQTPLNRAGVSHDRLKCIF